MLSFGIKSRARDTTISGLLSFVSSDFFKHVQKTSKSWKRFFLLRYFIRSAKKHFYRFENSSKMFFFFPPLFQTIMDNSLRHFCISGVFSNSHRPNPSPHPTNNVGRVYPEFSLSFNFQLQLGVTVHQFMLISICKCLCNIMGVSWFRSGV